MVKLNYDYAFILNHQYCVPVVPSLHWLLFRHHTPAQLTN